MKYQIWFALLLLLVLPGVAQVSSPATTANGKTAPDPILTPTGKGVARVNGVVLTDRDLLREMLAIFPYSRQHGGHFPKEMEPDIRKGALQMIIFEELVYQEAQRRKMQVPSSRLDQATVDFRKQFPSNQEYQNFLKTECKGSEQALRGRIRRSILIDDLLNAEVAQKSGVTDAEVRVYYDQHMARFRSPEQVSIQTISIVIPDKLSQEEQGKIHKRAEEVLRQAKATKNYQEFGALAEKVSDDDWRVMMGDHKAIPREKMPPPVASVAFRMKPNQVSELIRAENSWCIVRLNASIPAKQAGFDDIKVSLKQELQAGKTESLRHRLDLQLRKGAKLEVL